MYKETVKEMKEGGKEEKIWRMGPSAPARFRSDQASEVKKVNQFFFY